MRNFMISRRWAFLLPAVLTAVALLALACGGGGGEKKEAAEEGEKGGGEELFVDPNAPVVDASLGEWSIATSAATGKAGAITFSAKNGGTTEHELVLIKTDTPADQLALKAGEVDEDAAGQVVGEIEDVAPGKTVAATFDLAPGKYVFICNYAGHYQQGMHAAFTVEG